MNKKRLDGVFHRPVDRVTHVSTNPARPSLTSVIGRELVYSRRYDANRMTLSKRAFYHFFQLTKIDHKGPWDGKGVVSGH